MSAEADFLFADLERKDQLVPQESVIRFSKTRSVEDTAEVERSEMRWGRMVSKLANPKGENPTKDSCRLLSFAKFGELRNEKGSLRHDRNVESFSGLVGDYDGGMVTLEQAADLLEAAEVEAFLYSTPGHTADRPRWRVMVPFSKEVSPMGFEA